MLYCLSTAASTANPDSNKDPLQERYNQLEQQYTTLQSKGYDLSPLDQYITDIKKAKQKRDYKKVDILLEQFSNKLNATTSSLARSSDKSHTTNTNIDDLSLHPPKNETDALSQLSTLHNYRLLHQIRGKNRLISANGAAARNIKKFSDVAAQRDALWVLRRGLMLNDKSLIEDSLRAIDYAFNKQNQKGYFENGRGVSARKAVEVDAFFLQAYAHMYFLLKNNQQFSNYAAQMERYIPNVKKAMAWLRNNTDELYRQEETAANRLVFTGLAFLLNGKILNDGHLINIGHDFISRALTKQDSSGAFYEHGGFDSSYQAVSLLNLMVAHYYVADQALKNKIDAAIRLGMKREKSSIKPDGKIMVEGNTRTGLGQEKFLGHVKDVNYPEVALTLYYWGVISSSINDIKLAENISGTILNKRGYE
jgi:hypothetical protein